MEYANRVDFTGQTIYIGMDVHKKSWTVSILLEHLEHKTFTQPPEAAPLVSYLHRNFRGASYRAVYEAGYCGFWIHDQLVENGIACMVTNPADVPTRDKERRRKGDRSDSRKLARALRSGQLEGMTGLGRFSYCDTVSYERGTFLAVFLGPRSSVLAP